MHQRIKYGGTTKTLDRLKIIARRKKVTHGPTHIFVKSHYFLDNETL